MGLDRFDPLMRSPVDAVCELSIVIPAFNEARKIRSTVGSIADYLSRQRVSYELVVVDDGSTDQTVAEVREAIRLAPAVRLIEAEHAGKGCAIRRGVLAARGRFVVFLDADYSTRMDEWGPVQAMAP